MNRFELENRLVEFAVLTIELVESFPNTFVATHLGKQLIRSATSAALNYGEAQVAESRADFVHKMRLCLKELKESSVNLTILKKRKSGEYRLLESASKEASELVAIFSASIKTAGHTSRKS